MKLLLARHDTTEHQRAVLLRASWALLYAHYEGFVKTTLTVFFGYASNLVTDCGSLPEVTRLYALESNLRVLRNLPSSDFLLGIESFSGDHLSSQPVFPDVDTRSNLWPSVLKELLDAADIQLPNLEVHRASLQTLVSRRNSIAHGKSDMIQEISYYRKFESAVYDVMYELAFSVEERLGRSPYI